MAVLANLSQDFLRPFLPPKPFAGKVIETSAQISLQWMKVGLSSFCLVPDLLEANMYTQSMAQNTKCKDCKDMYMVLEPDSFSPNKCALSNSKMGFG